MSDAATNYAAKEKELEGVAGGIENLLGEIASNMAQLKNGGWKRTNFAGLSGDGIHHANDNAVNDLFIKVEQLKAQLRAFQGRKSLLIDDFKKLGRDQTKFTHPANKFC